MPHVPDRSQDVRAREGFVAMSRTRDIDDQSHQATAGYYQKFSVEAEAASIIAQAMTFGIEWAKYMRLESSCHSNCERSGVLLLSGDR